ncbi:MAG: AtpZ/AtpI family protein [Actinomycetota bacterium]
MSQPPQMPGRSTSSGSGGMGRDMAKGMSQASWGLSVAFGFVGVVLVFWLGGRFLDGRLGTDPWIQMAGALIGWVLGTVTVFYMARLDPEQKGRERQ